MRALCLTSVMAWLVVGQYAAGSEAGPSIEEMLSALEKSTEAEPKKHDAARTADRRPTQQERCDHTLAEIKKIQKTANWTYGMFRKHRLSWETVDLYIRLERFKEAAQTLWPMLKSRDPGPGQSRGSLDLLGLFELKYAEVMWYLGKEKTAESMTARHMEKLEKAKLDPRAEDYVTEWRLRHVVKREELVRGLPDALVEVEAIEDALAQEPSGDLQWQLVRICDPHTEKASLGLTWITAILEMISRYPDDPRVTGGEAHWDLQRAYRYHRLYDDALGILETYPKKFPAARRTERLDAVWEFAYVHREKGDFLRMIRISQEADTSFREALRLFKGFREKYPRDSRCKRNEDGWSHIDSQLRHLYRRLRD